MRSYAQHSSSPCAINLFEVVSFVDDEEKVHTVQVQHLLNMLAVVLECLEGR